ncbi:MAG TPA: D-aminoacylase [Vicinamibacterales bacterium]|nr:D-aminoacylase [Vicinamibacterales bacterium]
MQKLLFGSILAACLLPAVAFRQAQPLTFDVLIRNGRVMDGSGNPWLRTDVGIRGDRIAAVGRLPDARATTIIDAADRLVTPGFIDVHSHAGEGLSRPELRQAQPILAQGVTTVVINPDGGGPTDLAAQRLALETGGVGPNVALLIGHGSVRRAVMGSDNRRPTPDELDRMRALVRRAMQQGAFGLSSGLFYVPGSYATTEEVIALTRVAAEYGGLYTSHIRDEANYGEGVLASVQEVIRIADEARTIGIVSHMKALGPDNWGLSMALTMRIDQARARGVQVFADQYPYEASSTSLRAALLPGGAELPKPDRVSVSKDELTSAERQAREKLEATVRENIRRRGGPASIQIASYSADRALQGQNLDGISRARGLAPEVAAIQLMVAGDASIVSFNMSEDDIRQIMTRPYTMASSDGGLVPMGAGQPHPRNYGAFARRLSTYVREREVMSLEFAIRSMTTLPATVFGLKDRGVIREGAFADLAIFDPARVRDRATYTDPHQLAEGMSWVLVNGVPVVADGKFGTALPGKILSRDIHRAIARSGDRAVAGDPVKP